MQATQAPPLVAQPTLGLSGLHVLPAQQPAQVPPVEQLVQAPLTQLLVPQSVQAAPPTPQVVLPEATQLLVLSQQPDGHEVASHTQAPPTQRWPLAHLAPAPHMQVPPEQVSAVMPQLIVVEHEPPPAPQCVVSMAMQPVPVSHSFEGQPHAAPRQT